MFSSKQEISDSLDNIMAEAAINYRPRLIQPSSLTRAK
jgi:hypothetical protein